jgi:hypothetical protein
MRGAAILSSMPAFPLRAFPTRPAAHSIIFMDAAQDMAGMPICGEGGGSGGGLPDRVRLALDFDPARLAEDLGRFDEGDWVRHVVRANYEGDWTILPLRSAAGETHPLRLVHADLGASRFEDTRLLDRAPYLREVLGCFHCPIKTARLMRLSPGSAIKEHCDPGLDAAEGLARLHVVVATNDEVEFRVNRRPVAMEPGSSWYLRLLDPHSVANRGETDRVHLVIDATVNDWLDGMLREGAAARFA